LITTIFCILQNFEAEHPRKPDKKRVYGVPRGVDKPSEDFAFSLRNCSLSTDFLIVFIKRKVYFNGRKRS